MPIHAVRSDADRAHDLLVKDLRVNIRPNCPLCGEKMFAATASALMDQGSIRSLWSCDECGCGFTTERPVACH